MEQADKITCIQSNVEQMGDLLLKLKDMRNSKELVDCQLKTDDGTVFPVHKLILIASSEYFADLYKGDKSNNNAEFLAPGVKPTTMAIIVDFIYSQRVEISSAILWDLLVAAEMFRFTSLIQQCRECLTKDMTVTHCAMVYQRSRQHQLSELTAEVKSYIVKNFESIPAENEHLMNLTADELADILVDSRLTCKEEYLWHVVKTWLESCPEEKQYYAPKLLSCIRLGFLDINFIFDNIMRHPFVSFNQECREIVSERMELMWDLAEMMSMKYVSTKYIARPRLPNDLLFCVGGYEAAEQKATGVIEVYDSKADIWCEINEDMDCIDNTERSGHACVVLNHCLYVIGGQGNHSDVVHNAVGCLDLLSKQWLAVPSMIKARYGMCAVTIAGSIIVLGGSQRSNVMCSVETYNPKDNRWTFLRCMTKSRCWAGATVLGERIYIAGGTSNQTNSLKSAEVFDPETCTWNQIASMKEPRHGLSCVAFQGKIFAAGGTGLATVESYDPENNYWTIISNMREPRNYFTLTVLDGSIYAIGGIRTNSEDAEVDCDSEVYIESTNSWRPIMPTIHCLKMSSACAASCLPNIEDYLYKNRENVLEVKRKLLYEYKLKGVQDRLEDLTSTFQLV